jgi:hypothetical protein
VEKASPDPRISFWMVAFLDLLGFRSVLTGMDALPLPEDESGAKALTTALGRAVRFRRRLHTSFQEFIAGHEHAPAPDLSDLPPHLQGLGQNLRSIRLVNAPGPDHFILAASLAPSDGHFPLRAVYAVIMATASGMLTQLSLGGDDPDDTLPLRGGIDIAPGAVVSPEDFLYSPALVRAYELESSAVFPRTLLGDRVRQFLDSVVASTGTGIPADHAREIAKRVQSMLFIDADGKLALDFYGRTVRESLGDEPARTFGQRAWQYVVRAEAEARKRGVVRVTEKYEWLVGYMRSRRSYWD